MEVRFTDFIEALDKKVQTVVALADRTHYILTDKDEISPGWSDLFKVVEVVSLNYNSIVVKIKYIDED